MSSGTWRARFRFRLQKKLRIDAGEHRLEISGREVVLAPLPSDQTIADSDWLVMNARGFDTEGEAREFGSRLRVALEVSAVAARLGIDAGRDVATLQFSQAVTDAIARTGAQARENVHGLDVFRDGPNVTILGGHATATVRAAPNPFLSDLDELHRTGGVPSQRVQDLLLLLNYALMRPEPVAQIVFAVSAVESLGQTHTWTAEQKRLLRELAGEAERSSIGTDAERREVSQSIAKSLYRLSLRQGVFRLLESLSLGHLKSAWDDLYNERSSLIHGLAPKPGGDYGELAYRTVSLCGHVLLKAVAAEIPMAARHVAKLYAVPSQP